jgi:hypothetical protein
MAVEQGSGTSKHGQQIGFGHGRSIPTTFAITSARSLRRSPTEARGVMRAKVGEPLPALSRL